MIKEKELPPDDEDDDDDIEPDIRYGMPKTRRKNEHFN